MDPLDVGHSLSALESALDLPDDDFAAVLLAQAPHLDPVEATDKLSPVADKVVDWVVTQVPSRIQSPLEDKTVQTNLVLLPGNELFADYTFPGMNPMQRWPHEHPALSQEEYDQREQALRWQHHQQLHMQQAQFHQQQQHLTSYPPSYYHHHPEHDRSVSESSSSHSMPVSIASAPLPHPPVTSPEPIHNPERLEISKDLLEQSLKANGKPKRPMNAFLIYARHRRPEIGKAQPQLKTGEISGILSAEWKNMDMQQKTLWREQAKVLREAFNSRHPDYVYERSANGTRKHGSRGGKVPGGRVKRSPPTTQQLNSGTTGGWTPVYYY